MNVDNILKGWENFTTKSEVTEELAKKRATECSKCSFLKKGILLAFIKDKLKEVEGTYCDKCKCPLSAKVRSENEKCPLKKW